MTFKNLLKREIADSSLYGISILITQIGNFLLIPLFWRKLTPTDYGIIAIIDVVSCFVIPFLGLSLEQSITRLYYEWPEIERRDNIGTLWLFSWISSLILGSILTLILSNMSYVLFKDQTFRPYLFIGLIGTVLASFRTITFATIRIKKLPKLYLIYNFLCFILQIGFSILFVLILDRRLKGYFEANIISGILIILLCIIIMLKECAPKLKLKIIIDSLKYSLPLIPSNLISNITSVLDRFILQRYASLETIGIYSVSLKFATLINTIQGALKLSYGPFLFENIAKGTEEAKKLITSMITFYVFPIFFLGASIAVFIIDFVRFVDRPMYANVATVVPLLTFATIINTLNVFYAPGAALAKKNHLLNIPSLFNLVSFTVIGLLMIPKFQLWGVIITRLICAGIYFIAMIAISQKVYKFSYEWNKLIGLFSVSILFYLLSSSILLNSSKQIHLIWDVTLLLVYFCVCNVAIFKVKIKKLFFNKKSIFVEK